MRTELETIFGYVANIEMRPVPVWKLVAMPGAAAKLKTKGGTPQSSGGAAGFTMRNINPKSLLDFVARYLEVDLVPFFDETGIKDNIDMTLDALMTNPADISRALNNYNLDLILDKKEMLVIVIKDKAI
jgi:hypothetical protein